MADNTMDMQYGTLWVEWWEQNQVVFTFHSPEPLESGINRIIDSLNLDQLNGFLQKHNFRLKPYTDQDVPRPRRSGDSDGDGDDRDRREGGDQVRPAPASGAVSQPTDTGSEHKGRGLNTSVGKYFFLPPEGEGTSAITFFHVEKMNQPMVAATEPLNRMMSPENDATLDVVKLVNANRQDIQQMKVPLVSAMPNWLNGGTPFGCGTHGCPVSPPFPVPDMCTVSPGYWPITLYGNIPQSGETDLTVFVLDSLPTAHQVRRAAQEANRNGANQNLLLRDMAEGMVERRPFDAVPPAINVDYRILSDSLDIPIPTQPATGKDIYGTLVGFPMVDHGLFVAGIVRSIDNEVKIECVRVLNDFGVGNTAMLTSALNDIHDRFLRGELQRAVINLSLVATPADEELSMPPYNLTPAEIQHIRDGLYRSIASLAANFNVVFVASVGNDSDQRPGSMPSPTRFDARYPAAFAYDTASGPSIPQIIPVGAVDRQREVSYSNYPGPQGIATYGGGIPLPDPATPTPGAVTHVVQSSIDALRGVYTSQYYPGLYHDDPVPPLVRPLPAPEDYPEYPIADHHAWAYWSGTSFATPIISAIAARFLQNAIAAADVRAQVLAAAVQHTTWDRLKPSDSPTGTQQGPLIMATQCQSDVE
ncbi:MAG TPA: S8/S53 family peptidase [Ktedonobacteraceae bacterium]|nr:S8/S53 family peptidase [Ktedonobacteraceae bacterium]